MIKRISLLAIFPLLLCGCSDRTKKEEKTFEFEKNSPLIFSEFYKGLSSYDRAIEIYNMSDKEIDLSNYSINIYRQSENIIYSKIKLIGSLKSKDTFVVVDSKSNEKLLNKADVVVEELHIDGTWPISLNNEEKVCDVLGQIGYQMDYGTYSDLNRKIEYLVGREKMEKYDWIRYQPNDITHLGTIENTISEFELLEGPKLTEQSFKDPFINSDGTCGGGAIEVTLASIGDGDTTRFRFPSSVTGEYISSNESVRYLSINTPEIQHGDSIDAQPWGTEAKNFNNKILKNAKHYVIQTSKDSSLRENYGRMLAYVWYSNKDNPQPNDYVCLNFEMVVNGLAFMYFTADNNRIDSMTYKQVSYVDIMKNGELYAKQLGIKIHGETDPSFPY